MAAFFLPGLLIKNAQRIFGVGVRNHAISWMSALGQKQTSAVQIAMSALPPKANIASAMTKLRS
jgi:hypothetical protein